ncbi:JAB domain-containing protein, partial [Escherichia coli]|uniref:JAB domain-containing protein n=1 Tax=Escherichia coli TaxID=562 RepID=UPI0023793799
VSIKNDGHYFCRAGGNRPDGLNEPVTIKRALYHNAAAVVLAHNHPSGEVTPSKADRLITERLVQALGLVDIRVPDHLIVGGSQV